MKDTKNLFFKLFADQDRSAHKLGSLNAKKGSILLSSIVGGLVFE